MRVTNHVGIHITDEALVAHAELIDTDRIDAYVRLRFGDDYNATVFMTPAQGRELAGVLVAAVDAPVTENEVQRACTLAYEAFRQSPGDSYLFAALVETAASVRQDALRTDEDPFPPEEEPTLDDLAATRRLYEIARHNLRHGDGLSFQWAGITIRNPFLDDEKAYPVDPVKYYGQAFLQSDFCKEPERMEA